MTQSISIESAADLLNISVMELQQLCENDTGHKFHHLTAYSKVIRFYPGDLPKIRKNFKNNPSKVFSNF